MGINASFVWNTVSRTAFVCQQVDRDIFVHSCRFIWCRNVALRCKDTSGLKRPGPVLWCSVVWAVDEATPRGDGSFSDISSLCCCCSILD